MAEPKAEARKKDHSFRDFKGVNTQSDRKVIDDDEFAWLENVMPIGYGNARTIPADSGVLATLSSSCYYMAEGNISNQSYMFMFSVDGSCTQVNLATYAKTVVGAAGTFSGTNSRISQWKNERICIIDVANGYFDWDGTTLTTYKGSLQSVTVTSGGINFTNATTTVLTLSSGTATFSCTLGANLATLVAAGTGYAAGDVLTLSGGTFTSAATVTVSAVTSGAISGFNLTLPGVYTIAPTSPVSVTGGHGTGATFTMVFGIGTVTVVTPGTGYSSAPTISISGAGAGTGAILTVNQNVTANGTAIATYSGRIWIANARTILFTAPGTYNDFNPVDLAGSLIMTDDTLKSNISRLFAANNYLYIFGASSVNIISNVTVSTPTTTSTGTILTPSVTTFSNTNISSNMGTGMGDSIVSIQRTVAFGGDYGFFGLTGSTPQKISDHLEGIYANINTSQAITGGIAIIYGIQCLCYLVSYNDPILGITRPLLCIYFNKKWFFASQVPSSTIKFIAQASPIPDEPSIFATDGLNLYQLFSNTSSNIAQTIKTRLWDMGSPLITKQVLKIGMETISPNSPASLSLNVDTEYNTQSYSLTAGNVMLWKNNTGGLISWLNSAMIGITWVASGYIFSRADVNNVGNYIGQTITSNSAGVTYTGFHFQFEARTPWAGLPW